MIDVAAASSLCTEFASGLRPISAIWGVCSVAREGWDSYLAEYLSLALLPPEARTQGCQAPQERSLCHCFLQGVEAGLLVLGVSSPPSGVGESWSERRDRRRGCD